MLAQPRSHRLAETLELQTVALLRTLASTLDTLIELHPEQREMWLDSVEQRLMQEVEQRQSAAETAHALRLIIQGIRESNRCAGEPP